MSVCQEILGTSMCSDGTQISLSQRASVVYKCITTNTALTFLLFVLLGTLNTPPRCRVLETATTACWELAEMRLRLNILLVRCNQVCITEEKETNNNSPPKHPQKEYQKQLNTYFRFQINEFFAVKCTRNYMWQKWSSPNNHLHLATNTENPIRYQYHDSGCLRSAENSNRQ